MVRVYIYIYIYIYIGEPSIVVRALFLVGLGLHVFIPGLFTCFQMACLHVWMQVRFVVYGIFLYSLLKLFANSKRPRASERDCMNLRRSEFYI